MPGLYDASKPQATFLENWFLYRSALSASDDTGDPTLVTAVLDISKSFKGTGNVIRIIPRRVSGSGNVNLLVVRENTGSLASVQSFTTVSTTSNTTTLTETVITDLVAGVYRILVTGVTNAVWELHVATSVATSNALALTPAIVAQDFGVVWTPSTVNLAELLVFSTTAASSLPGITELVFRQYNFQATGGINFNHATALLTLDFPNLIAVPATAFFVCKNATSLTTITLPNFVPGNGLAIDFSGCALTAATVNAILARCVANAAFITGSVNLAGGTNAAPTGQGATDKTTLVARVGLTITTT